MILLTLSHPEKKEKRNSDSPGEKPEKMTWSQQHHFTEMRNPRHFMIISGRITLEFDSENDDEDKEDECYTIIFV